MRPRHLDRLFARFRRRGDPEALARLFDATAPELYRIATHLTKDLHGAEDLVQTTFLAAIEGRESWDEERGVLPWLVGILARQAAYERRRRSRVIEPDRLERAPSREPIRELEAQEFSTELSRAIDRLPAMYREVLIAHLRDGKDAQTLARDLNRAPGTVRVQLHRALEMVRKALPAGLATGLLSAPPTRGLAMVRAAVVRAAMQHAGQMASMATASPAAVVGGWAVTTKGIIGLSGLAICLALLGGYAVHEIGARGPGDATPLTTSLSAKEAPAHGDEVSDSHEIERATENPEQDGRVAVPGPPAPTHSSAHAPQPDHRVIEGSTLDVLASQVPGVPIEFHPDDSDDPSMTSFTTSDAQGHFRMEIANRHGHIRPTKGEWTGVFLPRVEPSGPASGQLVVVAPIHSLTGQVVDDAGSAVSMAEVRVELPGSNFTRSSSQDLSRSLFPDNEIRSAYPLSLERCDTAHWIVLSDSRGHFSISDAPRLPHAQLIALHQDYDPSHRPLPTDDADLRIVLRRSNGNRDHLLGVVVDEKHSPLSHATVFIGSRKTSTGADGRFDLDLGTTPDGRELIAVKEGWMPVIQPCLASSPLDPGAWPDPLVLVLGEQMLKIRGQVVDASGAPVPRTHVRSLKKVTLNEILGGGSAVSTAADDVKETVVGGNEVVAKADGRFELVGFQPGSYRLHIVDVRSLVALDTEPIEAGRSDVRIQLPGDGCYPCVAGQLVDQNGNPVVDMRVQARRTADEGTMLAEEVRSDAEGRFKLPSLSREAQDVAVLPVRGVPRLFRIQEFLDPCSMRLVIPRFGDVKVEVVSGLDADHFSVVDQKGETIQIALHYGGGGWEGPFTTIPIDDTDSEWAIVPEDAASIVLFKNGKEVARTGIHVKPDELNHVRM